MPPNPLHSQNTYQSAPHSELSPLSEGAALPLFRQVKRRLLKLIEARHYKPGDNLPSETELSSALAVSIGTVRKAVDELVFENILIRRQGKGTFVTQHNPDRFLFQFFHVERRDSDFAQEPEYPDVQCVGFEKTRASEAQAQALGLRVNDPVFSFGNRLLLQGRATVYDHIVLSALSFKGLTEKRLIERKGTIYQLYQEDYGISVLRTRESARAVAASREACRILAVPSGLPVIQVHRIALTFGDKPVEYRISTIDTREHDYVNMLVKR